MKKFFKKIIVKFNLIKILSIFFYIFKIFPISKKKIVFINFSGKGYGDNPKYIYDYINMKNKDLDYVWLVADLKDENFPLNIRKVKMFSIKSFFELATAQIWINNSRFDQFVIKRKKQYYIQTWHGGLALKKIEYDAENKLSNYYKKVMKNDNRMINLMLSNSKFCTNMYRNGFKYKGNILEVGSPRNDILINKKIKFKEGICKKYEIDFKDKIILYAPTFRRSYENNPYDINLDLLRDELIKKTGKKWNVLIKLHPRISDASKYIKNINEYTDVTLYNDIQELICSSDLVITDYSSTMFESMIAKKPVILYANDIKNYKEERGIYFKFEELPFPLVKNNEELKKCIEKIDFNNILKKYENFKNKVGLKETGQASKIIGDKILNIIEGEIDE